MTLDDEDYLFDCIEDIQKTVHENNIMLRQICNVINVHLFRHHQENEDDFGRNVIANLLSGLIDLRGFNKGK